MRSTLVRARGSPVRLHRKRHTSARSSGVSGLRAHASETVRIQHICWDKFCLWSLSTGLSLNYVDAWLNMHGEGTLEPGAHWRSIMFSAQVWSCSYSHRHFVKGNILCLHFTETSRCRSEQQTLHFCIAVGDHLAQRCEHQAGQCLALAAPAMNKLGAIQPGEKGQVLEQDD